MNAKLSLRSLAAEPLIHFLLVGAALFWAASWIWPVPETGRIITIGDAQLLEHLQARAQLYDEESFEALLENMSASERDQLVRDTAVAEALYREGEALGLSNADPLVRARVIQQMRLLLMEEAAREVDLSEEDARAFYAANQVRYGEGARASFTHVFFSAERRGGAAQADAEAALQELRRDAAAPAQAGQFGDRFLYQRNYSAASAREIVGQFGEGFALALFARDPAEAWSEILQSEHGWHVVALTGLEPARVPPFEEIALRVAEDALSEERSRRAMMAEDALMESYDVRPEGGQ